MAAAELTVGLIFVLVCVTIAPCMLVCSSVVDKVLDIRSRTAKAELDSDAESQSDEAREEGGGGAGEGGRRRRKSRVKLRRLSSGLFGKSRRKHSMPMERV